MKTFTLLFLLLTTYKTFGEECGINNAGVLMQQLTCEPMTCADGLFYDLEENKLYFVDSFKPALCCIDGKTAAFNSTPIPDVKYISAVIPIKNEKNAMVGLADNKFILLNLQRDSEGNIEKISTQDIEVVEHDSAYCFTTSLVDKKGRLWIDLATDPRKPDLAGKTVQIDTDNSIKPEIEGLLPSGIGFSPDNSMFYHVDGHKNVVYKYDFNLNTGVIKKPTVIYNLTEEMYFKGCICSMKVAKDNTLWLGICETGVLIKYNWQKKQYEQVHKLPALYPVSLELGGPNMDVVFFGTSKQWDDQTPAAGAVYAVSGTGSVGLQSYKMSLPSTTSGRIPV